MLFHRVFRSKWLVDGAKHFIKEALLAWRHSRGLNKAKHYRNKKQLKLHVGCGPNFKRGWINIDIIPSAELFLDLRKSLPFQEGSCSMIYSEHFLEHLSYPAEATFFLKECFRVLEPNGLFSVGVPDTEWPLNAYFEGEQSYYFQKAKEKWHPKWCITRMEHINYHFRQNNEHKFAYDFETLKHILSKVGFQKINRRRFNPNLDSPNRELGTLYVDAQKLSI